MVTHLLMAHANALASGNEAERLWARLMAQEYPHVLALMDVAERVHAALRPVEPDPAFRRQLKQDVMGGVPHQSLWERLTPRVGRHYWLWGAVASAVSVAGGLGYYLYRRAQVGARTG